jgi:oligoendopeptidase F
MKLREEIQEQYTWDLTPIYATDEAFEQDFQAVHPLLEKVVSYSGRLLESPETLKEAIDGAQELIRKIRNLFVYASLHASLDTTDTTSQSRVLRMQGLYAKVSSALAFFEPELLSATKEEVFSLVDEYEGLALYRQYLDNILRRKEHVLSEKEERIIASLSEVTQASGRTFSLLNDADMTFPTVKDSKGEDVALSHGTFIRALESHDRVLRENAYKGFYSVFLDHKNTLGSTLQTSVKNQGVMAKLRSFPSARAAALHEDNIPESVYDNLIASVHKANPAMYKYLRLRKEKLGVEKLHFYDVYVPLLDKVEMEIPFEKAREDVVAAMAPLGKEYQALLQRAFDERWIDVYETKGKRSGAFSSGTYDTPPYLLLNYQPNLDNVFTLAHELGHSMHTYLASETQPYVYADYSIFLAEIASTFNEALLTRYYLDTLTDPAQKLYVINHQLDSFKGTIFRQTMFAEFERNINTLSEAGESLTHEKMADQYEKLLKEYFSDEVVIDDEIRYEWSRIPHFYYNFYVFQYATGLSAAMAFSKRVLDGEEGALEDYLGFLKAGSSKYPVDVLKEAGVDMSDPSTVDAALSIFVELVDEFESLLKELEG